MIALLVMLNNFFHDLATAVFAVSAVAAYALWRHVQKGDHAALAPLGGVVKVLLRVGYGALVWIIVAGAIRAITYKQYEWVEAAGHDQVAVLAVKHVILGSLTLFGLVVLIRLHRRMRAAAQTADPTGR